MKTGTTTYSIDFVKNNDQFKKFVYERVEVGDKVKLTVLNFTKEIGEIESLQDDKKFKNNSYEKLIIYGFGILNLIIH